MPERLQFEVRPDPLRLRRLTPGFYVAANDSLHVSIPELLDALGMADTEANRDLLARQLATVARELLPEALCQIA